MKLRRFGASRYGTRRLPPGRRGLKLRGVHMSCAGIESPSPRKAWIETPLICRRFRCFRRRLPPGRRGLKQTLWRLSARIRSCRLPPGRRGLKPGWLRVEARYYRSPSPRKAWIETAGRVCNCARASSPSPRKAWIETLMQKATSSEWRVAFPPEGVD